MQYRETTKKDWWRISLYILLMIAVITLTAVILILKSQLKLNNTEFKTRGEFMHHRRFSTFFIFFLSLLIIPLIMESVFAQERRAFYLETDNRNAESTISLVDRSKDIQRISEQNEEKNKEMLSYFPLSEGNYWIYHGTYRTNCASGICTDTLTWKMEVKEVIRLRTITVYIIKGFPFLLKGYILGSEGSEDTILDEEYLVVQVGSDTFYQCGIAHDDDVSKIKNSKEEDAIEFMVLSGIINEQYIFLDSPLTEGKQFSSWGVIDSSRVTLKDIKGMFQSNTYVEYIVDVQNSYSEDIFFNFVPQVGITEFYFGGHGHEGDIQLVEISLNKRVKK